MRVHVLTLAAARCPHCRAGAPHHTNAASSISGDDRYTVWDLHEVEDAGGVGLTECLAAELWMKAQELEDAYRQHTEGTAR